MRTAAAELVPRKRGRVLALVAVAVVTAVGIAIGRDGSDSRSTRGETAAPARVAYDAVVAPGPMGTLAPGDEGAAVRGIQEALVALGFAQSADGAYGPSTSASVSAFQREHGLRADGVLGRATADALARALADRARADAELAEDGLNAAVADQRLSVKSARRYASVVTEALARGARLPPDRSVYLALVLRDVAGHAEVYDEPRALALFAMLEANAAHLARRDVDWLAGDIAGDDGVVYRFVPGHAFQFHPIASFARLNALAGRRRAVASERLGKALLERAVRIENWLEWEYYFPFRGPTRWSSGFAQAVAAQALARAGRLTDEESLTAAAAAAFRALAGDLSMDLAGGKWVKEYGFVETPILNAQLQTLLSVRHYAEITGDDDARAFAEELAIASRALLPRFDTGCWSLYSLAGSPASAHYHAYHVELLQALGKTDPVFEDFGNRWERYLEAGRC